MTKYQMLKLMFAGREITAKRVFNFARNYLSMKLKKTTIKGYPSILMIEPTNYCNLRCPLCPTGNGSLTAPRGNMAFDNFKKLIDETGDYLLNVTLWNFGEPFLNPEIYQMIDYLKNKRIFVRISTNGHLLNNADCLEKLVNSDLDELIVSLDGASQETFLTYRQNGDFQAVIKNLKSIIDNKRRLKKKKPFVELQFIIMRHNEQEIPEIKRIAKEIGVDKLKLKTLTLDIIDSDKEELKKYLPQTNRYSRYQNDLKRKVAIKNQCLRLWLSSVINWDGSVTACCYDPNRLYEFGNCFKGDPFSQVWNSPKYIQFRKLILTNKQKVFMCANCPGKLMGLDIEE